MLVDRLRTLASRIRASLRMHRVERDFSDEVQSHLLMLTDEYVARGLSPADAHRAAVLRLGGLPQLRESYRDRSGLPAVDQLWSDIRYALRLLRKNPGFTTAAVVTLALGIGANTAIFTVVDAVLTRTLPVDTPESLVTLGDPTRVAAWSMGTPRTDVFSYPLYRELRDHTVVFSSVLASARLDNADIEIDGGPEHVSSRLVTANYFETLGVRPALGRLFAAQDDAAPGVDPFVVISYDYWQRRFGGKSAVVGRLVHLKHATVTIIGVAACRDRRRTGAQVAAVRRRRRRSRLGAGRCWGHPGGRDRRNGDSHPSRDAR